MRYLRQSTTVTLQVGPFLDSTDGVTPENGLAGTMTVQVSKAGAAFGARSSATAIAFDADGFYRVELNTTDTATVGAFMLKSLVSGACPVWHEFTVIPQTKYDAFIEGTVVDAANVTQWNSAAVATPAAAGYPVVTLKVGTGTGEVNVASGVVPANVTQINGGLTTGNNATLSLKALNIVNSAGNAILAQSTGSSGTGLWASGNGASPGIYAEGGATGDGLLALGGASGGSGIKATGQNGSGINASSIGGSGDGLKASGNGNGSGIWSVGGATSGNGILATAAAGHGISATSSGSNGHGMILTGNGSGAGFLATGGATGHGATCTAGAAGNGLTVNASGVGWTGVRIASTNGHGLSVNTGGNGTGISVTGTGNGNGLVVTAGATAEGALFVGGSTSGDAIRATATNGDGIELVGGTNGSGLNVTGAGIGAGLKATGGATGDGIYASGGATSGNGMELNGTGGQVDLNSDVQVTSFSTAAKAEINTEVLDVLTVDTFAEPTGVPAATTTIVGKLGRVYATLRNKLTVDGTHKTLYNDGGTAEWRKPISDSGSTYTEDEGTTP